jgi:hypothetical protein
MDASGKRPISERAKVFHAAIETECLPCINKATVPIIMIKDDFIVHNRTGVLYCVAGCHFVLTAAHFLRGYIKDNTFLGLSPTGHIDTLLPLGDALFHSTEIYGRGSRDVAAIWIPEQTAIELRKTKEFIRHNQISMNEDPDGLYVFFGYPGAWAGRAVSEVQAESTALVFSTFEIRCPDSPIDDYDANVHLLLNYTASAIRVPTGNVDPMPDLHGISGCGIWRVGDKKGKSAVPRNAKTLALVAIQHTWYREPSAVMATRIAFPLQLIASHYEEAGRAMDLAYPRGYA